MTVEAESDSLYDHEGLGTSPIRNQYIYFVEGGGSLHDKGRPGSYASLYLLRREGGVGAIRG